ncbi:hypothetical protein F2Q69_00051741 [Brassica cretica]|uniref:Uncharacterized protein n=1 Tax=Brassica cretica TaxID=69181 RepID=A0A8S9PI17_BRACR|nr:hypothetical protein F2Q69_00051741 [Brassica cretica]
MEGRNQQEKLMASAIRAGTTGRWNAEKITMAGSDDANFGATYMGSPASSTVFSTGFSEPCASSGTMKKTYQRRRPPKSRRKPRPLLNAEKEEGVLWDKAADKRVEGRVPDKSDKFKQLDVTEWLTTALGPLKGRCGKGKSGLASGQGTDASQVNAALDLTASFASLKLN